MEKKIEKRISDFDRELKDFNDKLEESFEEVENFTWDKMFLQMDKKKKDPLIE
jgi:hypothetical protein|tara:strand:+ start:1115 stop:1273 length:159 start_codon:yes stop_codon:yes gene_type:complete